MTNIKETWQAAVAERGDGAFELFETETMAKWWADFDSNESFERLAFLPKANTRLKPIAELVELDIDRYGDDAYLMYQWRHDYDDFEDCGYKKDTEWKSPKSNADCEDLAGSSNYILERKLAANAPFTLEWAKSGVEIEFLYDYRWFKCEFKQMMSERIAVLTSPERPSGLIAVEKIRHPFPPVVL
jgi:hypothetical protein